MPRKKNVETKVIQALRKEHLKTGSSLSFDEWLYLQGVVSVIYEEMDANGE